MEEDDGFGRNLINVARCIRQPLEHSNSYIFWKSQMRDLLNLYGLTDVVNPNQTIPIKNHNVRVQGLKES